MNRCVHLTEIVRPPRRYLFAAVIAAIWLAFSSPAHAADLDYAIPGGWFFTQGGGDSTRVDDGFAVIDDERAQFWTAFQADGGVAALGYPISDRFEWDGFVTQVMQKAVFQWRPDSGSVAFVNVFDDLSRHGFDDELAELLVPEPDAFDDEAGLDFGQIIAKRTALLGAERSFLTTYQAATDPLRIYGLPQSRVRDYDGLRAIRLQRAVLQIWTRDFPWAQAGTVTIANGGDLAKQLGLFRQAASAFAPVVPMRSQPVGEETSQVGEEMSGQDGEMPEPSTAQAILAGLAVNAEQSTGYRRGDWRHWSDLDSDGCDTRCEVLADERRPGGDWYSVYDGRETSNPSTFDIDHLVPLAEAYESGGWNWSGRNRELFANDLSYEHSLIAVSASSNRSKGKRDPAEWLPPAEAAHCFYAEAWIVVKWRWSLSVDPAEKNALIRLLDGCPETAIGEIAPPQADVGQPPDGSETSGQPPGGTGTGTSAQVTIGFCNAGSELVQLRGPAGFDLGGWRINDQGSRFSHTFAGGTRLGDDGTFLIASGIATGDLRPWGGRHVWNNDGDVATLTNSNGQVADTRNCT